MNGFNRSAAALAAMLLMGVSQSAPSSEPAQDLVPSREAVAPLQFTHLCVRPCDCGKPTCGIVCRPPAFTCCDDYCPKTLPRISLCWPMSRCDDYCPKPLPCWPPDPCACKPFQAGRRHMTIPQAPTTKSTNVAGSGIASSRTTQPSD